MTLILELAPEEEMLLGEQAQEVGLSPQDYAKRAIFGDPLATARRLKKRRGAALLRSWIEESRRAAPDELAQAEKEWRETARGLDQDRALSRPLFPELGA